MAEIETHLLGESSDDELLAVLERDGAVILQDMLEPSDVAEALRQVDPFIAGTGLIDHELIGKRTTRTGALATRSGVARSVIVMPPGSVLLYTGTVEHGGGANESDEPRIGMNITYLLHWLRQEENQYLSCPPSVAAEFDDPELRSLLGYSTGNGGLGYYSSPSGPSANEPEIGMPEEALGAHQPIAGDAANPNDVF